MIITVVSGILRFTSRSILTRKESKISSLFSNYAIMEQDHYIISLS
jgi:hypothetical protein